MTKEKLPHIHILAMGGTIAGQAADSAATTGYQAGAVGVEELLAAVPQVREVAEVSGEQLAAIDSKDITAMEQIKLARHKNVFIESGGITWLFNDEFYPFPSAIRAIKEAANEVGMEKLMWGSDYPRTITAITYKMSYDFVEKSPELTADEKRLFLGENAKKFFGFGELPDLPYIKNMSE